MVRIHNLEVRFDVEGDSDEAVFAQLFQRYIQDWSRQQTQRQRQQQLADRDRALGDRGESN
jgi:hypothetical protein